MKWYLRAWKTGRQVGNNNDLGRQGSREAPLPAAGLTGSGCARVFWIIVFIFIIEGRGLDLDRKQKPLSYPLSALHPRRSLRRSDAHHGLSTSKWGGDRPSIARREGAEQGGSDVRSGHVLSSGSTWTRGREKLGSVVSAAQTYRLSIPSPMITRSQYAGSSRLCESVVVSQHGNGCALSGQLLVAPLPRQPSPSTTTMLSPWPLFCTSASSYVLQALC